MAIQESLERVSERITTSFEPFPYTMKDISDAFYCAFETGGLKAAKQIAREMAKAKRNFYQSLNQNVFEK